MLSGFFSSFIILAQQASTHLTEKKKKLTKKGRALNKHKCFELTPCCFYFCCLIERINTTFGRHRPHPLKETSFLIFLHTNKAGINTIMVMKSAASLAIFKSARFCNLNLLRWRLKFRVKFHGEILVCKQTRI